MDNIRPLKTEADYDWAIAEISGYFDNEPTLGTADADRFDVLADLIEVYEAKHYPIEAPDPVATIRSHMEMFGLNQAALASVLGSRSRASEILNRRRALTADMIFSLSKAWRIPAEALVQPYHLTAERSSKRQKATT